MIFLCLLILSTWSVASSDDFPYAEDNLEKTHGQIIHASVIFRHGDRTPVFLYPNLDVTEKNWREGLGQLNNKGKLLMYNLGKWLYKRYNKTDLNEGYRYDRVRVDSSDLDRTLESAQLVLAGMFPPQEKEIWADEDGLNWQPIAVHTKPLLTDEMIIALAPCKKYDKEKEEVNLSKEWLDYYDNNVELFRRISTNAKTDLDRNNVLNTVKNIGFVTDTLLHMQFYGMTIPDWAKMEKQKMNEILIKHIYAIVCTEEMQRLRAGPLLGNIVKEMQDKVMMEPPSPQVLHMYSGHDVTLSALLFTFGKFEKLPEPGATFLFELRLNNDVHYVTMFYKNDATARPERILIKGCGNYCTLEDFISATAYIIPVNWQEECDSV